MRGATQTHGTCWLYTIINGFILSEDGQKILYDKMIEFYKSLTLEEKRYFRDGIDAPCPRGTGALFKPLFFYKFLDQYLCFMRGHSPRVRKGLSPILLRNNIKFTNKVNLSSGGVPDKELFPVLDRLGFKGEYNVRALYNEAIERTVTHPKFLVSVSYHYIRPKKGYDLMCAALHAIPLGNRSISHAICGYITNGEAYVFDSNFPDPFPCKWWIYSERERLVAKMSNDYKSPYSMITNFYSVYAKRDYASRIHPACLRQQKPGPWWWRRRSLSPSKNLPTISSTVARRIRSRGIKRKSHIVRT